MIPRLRAMSAMIALAALLLGDSAPTAAQSLSEKLSRQITEAHKAESSRNYESALRFYGAALDAPPSGGDELRRVLKMRARLFEQLEEYSEAERDLTEALGVAPLDPSVYVERGYFYMRRKRYDDALADFVAGSKLEPGNPVYRYASGRVENALGRYARAIENYDHALRLDPRYARAMLARAEANLNLGRHQIAHADYTRALAHALVRADDRFFALLGRGYVSLQLGEFAGAVADFDGALAINPNAFNALAWRGYAHERRGRPDLALGDYERASAYDPADGPMRANVRRLRTN